MNTKPWSDIFQVGHSPNLVNFLPNLVNILPHIVTFLPNLGQIFATPGQPLVLIISIRPYGQLAQEI